MTMRKEKKLFKEDVFPSIEYVRRTGHRVTFDEHVRACQALGVKPRMGRPPKGADRHIPISLRFPPSLLAWTKVLGKQRKMGYQTAIINLLIALKKRDEMGQRV